MGTIGQYLRNRPRLLERLYSISHRGVLRLSPLIEKIGFERADRWLQFPEELTKRLMFDCTMCGQCILHSTGMTCPMTCPKNLRNGPCGGVREDGNCEVKPEMRCIWVEAFERSQRMTLYRQEMMDIQPPVNRQLEGDSAWINMLTGADQRVSDGWDR